MAKKIVYVEAHKGKSGKWSARSVSRNGNELSRVSEVYNRRGAALNALHAIRNADEVVIREPRPVKRRRR